MEVRPATVADAEAIERIRVRGWQAAYRHAFPPERLDAMTVDWSRWEERLRDPQPGTVAFVAGDPVVGWALAGPSRDEDGIGELYGLYVDPDAWSQGAGRALIQRVERELARDVSEAMLWVLDDNPRARRFYERAGWRPDGGVQHATFLGVEIAEARYRKRLRPAVLFVCVHNAGRSQMAAALLRERSAGRIDVLSAGSEPADALNPAVVEAMREIGIDLSAERPKRLTDAAARAADVVVTMGCGDACPVYPGKRYEDWALDDPAGKDVAAVRRIRDEIDGRVRRLAADLVP